LTFFPDIGSYENEQLLAGVGGRELEFVGDIDALAGGLLRGKNWVV
jgi:hypothetical protein